MVKKEVTHHSRPCTLGSAHTLPKQWVKNQDELGVVAAHPRTQETEAEGQPGPHKTNRKQSKPMGKSRTGRKSTAVCSQDLDSPNGAPAPAPRKTAKGSDLLAWGERPTHSVSFSKLWRTYK